MNPNANTLILTKILFQFIILILMKVAIVTGSNKGIGRAIVETFYKGLAKDEWKIYLTARNEELGKKTLKELEKLDIKVNFHQLDIDCSDSRSRLKEYVISNYGALNILVNNAGIAYKGDSTAPFSEQAEVTIKTNFFSTLRMCEEFIPILAKDARLVNVSSFLSLSALRKLVKELYNKFISPMTITELEGLMNDFIRIAEEDKIEGSGWPKTAYGVSKLGATKMSFILAQNLKCDPRNIVLNACCPGYVDTDMTSHQGPLTVYEGADTPVYLATLPIGKDCPNGAFVSKRTIVNWK